ncbi:dephospho-CoA kinase [Cryobacterium melibiosiphilum]|uniref:Dephospho-CoA kinase n=1 Tax=Cryobacterium melibiosiphilum TaxID=995039 RepID=A0A3A5MRZ0_9MICO|nr:dephospho-CoA kinase [Cryobacterium melibiosiphilum]RJT89833.1 dephospho-CoA kinase [Cryobacterium melibiosiphilum]
MYLIGLTGGIASGKSFVAARLAEYGAVHIDADQLARIVVEPGTPALDAIADEFGEGILRPDGTLDRPALGAIIFADEERRERLNAIVHPAVWQRTGELIAEAEVLDPHAVVVYDVPLLAEAAEDRRLAFDLIVVVRASTETRVQRMIDTRGMTRAGALERIQAQATDAERLALADVVIDNDGDRVATLQQIDALWHRVSASAQAS